MSSRLLRVLGGFLFMWYWPARRLDLTNARVDQGGCVPPVLERRSRLPRSLQRAAQERQPFQIEARDLL
ncbi:MAG TPA: hypothetical protein VHM28_12345, partial [Anaerolineales bacterium]|nr:hypothetical protein [Anaerolineales bacterium]